MYHHSNTIGSIRLISNSSGEIIFESNYSPFGLQYNSSNNSEFKYAGKSEDSSTGLYFFESRYYDPNIGRFISPDPVSLNLEYHYAKNNPIKYVDPNGAKAVEEKPFMNYISRAHYGTMLRSPYTYISYTVNAYLDIFPNTLIYWAPPPKRVPDNYIINPNNDFNLERATENAGWPFSGSAGFETTDSSITFSWDAWGFLDVNVLGMISSNQLQFGGRDANLIGLTPIQYYYIEIGEIIIEGNTDGLGTRMDIMNGGMIIASTNIASPMNTIQTISGGRHEFNAGYNLGSLDLAIRFDFQVHKTGFFPSSSGSITLKNIKMGVIRV